MPDVVSRVVTATNGTARLRGMAFNRRSPNFRRRSGYSMDKSRLELLRDKENAVKAAIAAEKVKQQQQKERDKARLASIIGLALIEVCDKQPESVGFMVRQILSASSLRETDRSFLAAKGWC
jgi:hypothetical protein